jgi:dynein heavy chain
MFEEELIKIRCTCNIFITMNQTYVGRIPLPDNLKSLFRPVAMVLPDYTRIIEISLYSIGFTNSRDLAKKVVATFMLCNEQCSAQCHYDFGLRAHKAVLDSAHMKKIELSST